MTPTTRQSAGRGQSRAVAVAACCLALFVFALYLRIDYQQGSEEVIDIRADAAKYFTAAFNLSVHGAHSLDRPDMQRAPQTRTDLAPGFPLFLALFFSDPPDSRVIKPRVQFAHAILGALTCLSTLLLAYSFLPLAWAVVAGILVAINPHSIALTELMLTETLFTFLLMSGLALAVRGWMKKQVFLLFLGFLLLGFAAKVRVIGLVAPIALVVAGILVLWRQKNFARGAAMRLGAAVLAACALVYGAQLWFSASAMSGPAGRDVVEREYAQINSPLNYLAVSSRPPGFFVAGLSHIATKNGDAELRLATEKSFFEVPGRYLLWNCCARWFYAWHFDNAYNGDVNIYPMRVSAFDNDALLRALHTLMQWLHWPLFILALVAAALALRNLALGRSGDGEGVLAMLSLVFLGLFVATNTVFWLPRYSIPLRPLSYVLVVALLLRWQHGFKRA